MFPCVTRRVCCSDASVAFFFNDTATTEIYTLSLHDALPISGSPAAWPVGQPGQAIAVVASDPPPYGTRVVLQQGDDLGCGHAAGGQQDHHRAGGCAPLPVWGVNKLVVPLVGRVGVHMGGAHTGG